MIQEKKKKNNNIHHDFEYFVLNTWIFLVWFQFMLLVLSAEKSLREMISNTLEIKNTIPIS